MRVCGELEATRRIFFVICEIDFPSGVVGDEKKSHNDKYNVLSNNCNRVRKISEH